MYSTKVPGTTPRVEPNTSLEEPTYENSGNSGHALAGSLSVGSLEAEGLEFHPNIGRRINHRISIEMKASNGQMNRATNTAHSL